MASDSETNHDLGSYNAVSYIPIVIIALGLIGNTCSFLLFSFNNQMNKYSSMVFLSFIAVTDTLGLFTWNLDHFLKPNFGISIQYFNLFTCKFFVFIQYVSLESSGLLHSMISVDRYFLVTSFPGSVKSRLPFGTRKSAFLWSVCIVCLIVSLNAVVLVLNGYYDKRHTTLSLNNDSLSNITLEYERLVCYGYPTIKLWPVWERVFVVIYTIIPFIVMSVFNLLLVRTICKERKVKQRNGPKGRKAKLTISLTVITCLFILMTLPGSLTFGFFGTELMNTPTGHAVLIALDSIMFFHSTMLFAISYLTNKRFSEIVKQKVRAIVCCRRIINDNLKAKSFTRS